MNNSTVTRQSLGKITNKMMKKLSQQFQRNKIDTNHCIRSTVVTNKIYAGRDVSDVAAVTGINLMMLYENMHFTSGNHPSRH